CQTTRRFLSVASAIRINSTSPAHLHQQRSSATSTPAATRCRPPSHTDRLLSIFLVFRTCGWTQANRDDEWPLTLCDNRQTVWNCDVGIPTNSDGDRNAHMCFVANVTKPLTANPHPAEWPGAD